MQSIGTELTIMDEDEISSSTLVDLPEIEAGKTVWFTSFDKSSPLFVSQQGLTLNGDVVGAGNLVTV